MLQFVATAPDNRRAQQIRIAANTFEALVRHFEGQIFLLQQGDIIFICKDADVAAVDNAVDKVRFLFGDDPLAARSTTCSPTASRLGTISRANTSSSSGVVQQIYKEEQRRQKRLAAIAGDAAKHARLPMDPQALAELINVIARADLTNVLRRQAVCAMAPGEQPKPIYRELYVSIPDLRDAVMPKRDIASDRWLFQYLTQTLDKRVLAHPERDDDSALAHSYSINLNVSTLLSPEFQAFDQSLRAGSRGSIVIETRKGRHLQRSRRLYLRPRFRARARLSRLPRRRHRLDLAVHRSRAAGPRSRQGVLDARSQRSGAAPSAAPRSAPRSNASANRALSLARCDTAEAVALRP